jgi:hypothetical protein
MAHQPWMRPCSPGARASLLLLALNLRCIPALAQDVSPPAVEVQVVGAELSLFPTPESPARLWVRACRHVADPATLTARLVLYEDAGAAATGYLPCEPVKLELLEPEEWYQAELIINAEPQRLAMVSGKVIVRGAAGSHPVRVDVPLRLGRGAIAFLQRRTVQTPGGPRSLDVACLENPLLRAEIIPELGCVSALIPRATASNLLATGDDTSGLRWEGTGVWEHTSQSPCGPTVGTVLTSRWQGGKLRMQVTLAENEGGIRVLLDSGGALQAPGPVVIAGTVGAEARVLLQKGGTQETVIPGVPARSFALGANATVQAQVSGATPGMDLLVAAQGTALCGLQVGMDKPGRCALAFSTGAAAPGALCFILAPLPAACANP